MQTQDFNSDARPLPAGWTQHFEPTKQLWYYVQTSVMPPKISFIHPADIVPANRSTSPHAPINNTHMPQPQLVVSPMQTPENSSQSDGGLTFAQQLYASSMSSSLDPMINSRLPTSQRHVRNLPTPPPSSSPPPGTGAHFRNTPVNEMLSQSYQTSSHTINRPTPNFTSTPSSAPPFSNPHRTNTFRTPILPSNNSYPQRHRASTYDQGMSQHSANVNPLMAGSRPTRHLVTMARPPDQQSSSGLSPLLLEPPVTVHSAPAIPSPPPASSVLFLQATGTPLTSPLTPPPTIAQSTPATPSNISSVLSVPSGTAYDPQSSISSLGRVASGSAIISNGGVAQSLGVGLADGIIGVLQSVLLTPSTGVDHLSLQAVIQGRPDADYQRIINALIKLHQHQHQQFSLMKLQVQQPPPFTIDYQALVTEVRRLQGLAQAQQVTTAQQQQEQQQLPQLQTSAQLQADQQQRQTAAQQYQALVRQRYQQQQQAAQYQALLQQQQQQATTQAQQNQVLLHAYPRPPQQPQQSQQSPTAQALSTVQTYLEAYKQFQLLNPPQGAGAGDTGGGQTQLSFDPTSLYSDNGGGGGFDFSQSFAGNGSQDSGGLSDFLSVSFSQDN